MRLPHTLRASLPMSTVPPLRVFTGSDHRESDHAPMLEPTPDLLAELAAKSKELESATPQDILRWTVERFAPRFTMATAFGPEGMVILHMLAEIAPETPVFNIETGYQFIERVEVSALVAEVGQFPKRQLRLGMSIAVELAFIGGRVRAEIVNLSQQGARIECDALLAIDQPLRLCSGILPEVRARVRWRSERQYGLVFDDTFSLSELALFAAGAQSPDLLAQPASAVSLRR